MAELTLVIAFIAGLLSFVSPCILPLVPAFLAYLTGVTAKELEEGKKVKLKIILNTLSYVIGFSLVFSVYGVLIQTLFSNVAYDLQIWINRVGGIFLIFLGIYLLGLIKLEFMQREIRMTPKFNFSISYLVSFMFGATFATAWIPCVGAILGAILTLAATNPNSALPLMLSYSAGLGVPFLITGIFSAQTISLIKKYRALIQYVSIIAGVMIIFLGILVFTGNLSKVSNFVAGPLNYILLSK